MNEKNATPRTQEVDFGRSTFYKWLVGHIVKDSTPNEVSQIMKDQTALQFLMAWSLFEPKCLEGFAKPGEFEKFVQNPSLASAAYSAKVHEHFVYFHNRYKGKDGSKKIDNLFYQKASKQASVNQDKVNFKMLIDRQADELDLIQKAKILIWVVYRYRNNIFHGNKGLASWLRYKEPIQHCTKILMIWLDGWPNTSQDMQEQGSALVE
jgi:hypothetical protein